MSKVKSRKIVMLTKWDSDIDSMICACLFSNPLCSNCSNCEELEITINPYDDIENVCREHRNKYKRVHNRLRQY